MGVNAMTKMASIYRHLFQTSRCLLFRSSRFLSTSHVNTAPNHMSVTADQNREDVLAPAVVTDIEDISKTVKLFKLHVDEKRFIFKSGQWVDMFIPGVDTVGGFSMSSAPHLLTSTGTFHLAIKFAEHPPAYWAHTKCKVGDCVKVRAGGNFYYDPSVSDVPSDLVLFAGGVGINPLYSILQHFAFLSSQNSEQTKQRKAILVYSAKTANDLLFKEELRNISKQNSDIKVKFRCTKESDGKIHMGHIDQSLVKKVVMPLEKTKLDVFICGPFSFINDMESYCLSSNVLPKKIHYEKWW